MTRGDRHDDIFVDDVEDRHDLLKTPAAPEEGCKNAQGAARQSLAKAQSTEDAIHGPKAVNPKCADEEHTRSPVELLDVIGAKGREAEAALAGLRELTH